MGTKSKKAKKEPDRLWTKAFYEANYVIKKTCLGRELTDEEAELRDSYFAILDNFDVIQKKNDGEVVITSEMAKWIACWTIEGKRGAKGAIAKAREEVLDFVKRKQNKEEDGWFEPFG